MMAHAAEQICQFIRDSMQAELADGTFKRDWLFLQFKFPTRPMPATTPFAQWHHWALGSLRGAMRSALTALLPFFK